MVTRAESVSYEYMVDLPRYLLSLMRSDEDQCQLEFFQLFDQRGETLLPIELHQALLLGRWAHHIAQSRVGQIEPAWDPDIPVGVFDGAYKAGHAVDRKRLTRTRRELQRRVLQHLAVLPRPELQLRRYGSGEKLTPGAVAQNPSDLEILHSAIGAVAHVKAGRASFVAGHPRHALDRFDRRIGHLQESELHFALLLDVGGPSAAHHLDIDLGPSGLAQHQRQNLVLHALRTAFSQQRLEIFPVAPRFQFAHR